MIGYWWLLQHQTLPGIARCTLHYWWQAEHQWWKDAAVQGRLDGAGWARLLKEARGRRGTTAGIKDTLPQYREMLGFARLCMRQKGRSQVQAVEVGEDRSHGRWTKNLCDFPLGRKWEGGLNPLTSLTHFNHTIPNHNLTTQDFGAILCKVLPLSWLPAGCGGGRPGNGEAGLGPEYDDGRLTFRWSWAEAGTHCTGPFFEHFCRSGNGRPSISFILDPYFLSCFCFCIFSVQWDGKVLKFL